MLSFDTLPSHCSLIAGSAVLLRRCAERSECSRPFTDARRLLTVKRAVVTFSRSASALDLRGFGTAAAAAAAAASTSISLSVAIENRRPGRDRGATLGAPVVVCKKPRKRCLIDAGALSCGPG